MHLSTRLALAAMVLGPALPTLAQQVESLPTQAPTFTETSGLLEFSGIMIARPLQAGHGESFGLTEDQISARAAAALKQLAAYAITEYVAATDEYLFRVPAGSTENSVAASLMAAGNFQYVEPDWTAYPVDCPNDTRFNQQWHHNANRMDSCDGWSLHTGNPSTVVAICDTGIRTTHVDFAAHRQEGFNAVNNLWESQGGQITDINGHGTATSGCAAANGNDGAGVTGVGWDLGHRMMRVTNSSSGGAQMSDLTQSAREAVDAGDRVASVSYSGVTSSSVDTAGAYVRANGGLLIWAAGNEGATLSGNRDDNVIIVGATTSSDGLSGFSNRGSLIDLVAPGSSVYTTSNSGGWGAVSGTSFSCPLVAGLCGLIFSYDPSLTPAEAEQILRDGCDDLGSPGVDNTFGYGRIDVQKTLEGVSLCDGPENYCFSSANSVSAVGSIISYTGSNSVAINNMELISYNNPAGQYGVFFSGLNQIAQSFGNGYLCVGGSIQRLGVLSIDMFGFAWQPLDVAAMGVGVGDALNFQFWFRDPAGGGYYFNTSDALEVVWCP